MSRRPSALARLLDLRPGERALVLRAGGVYALVLTANYMLRPLRDALALTGGSSKLPWLFTATFVGVLIAAPLIGWAAARLGRARLVEVVYGVCALVLVGLWGALGFGPRVLASQAFFVWISIFNLIAVSMLWSVLADRLRTADAGRLFGLIAFGGSLGAIVGPTVAALVVGRPLWGARRGPDADDGERGDEAMEDAPIGGSAWEGFVQVLRSPALAGICLYLLLMTTTATVVYFEQELIIERTFADDAARTTALAGIDLAVNVLSLSAQALLTGRIIRRFGLGVALAALPLVTAVGLGLLGLMPALAIVAGLQIVRRASNYALAKPAREVLFTAVPRSARYKAKSMIDTVIYRGGDALAGWAFTGLGALGLGLGAIAWITAPLALLWTGLGWRLGADADAAERREDAPPPPPPRG